MCDIRLCLLGAAPCFPRLASALPDESRETCKAAEDGNTGLLRCLFTERDVMRHSLSFAVGWGMSAGFKVTTQAWWGRTHRDRLLFLLPGSKIEFLKCVCERERKSSWGKGLLEVMYQYSPSLEDSTLCVCECAFPTTVPAGFLPKHCDCAA